MPVNEREALIAYVDDVAKATKDGKIEWSVFNPTTYTWDRPSSPFVRLVLQRVEHLAPTIRFNKAGETVPFVEKRLNYILNVNNKSDMKKSQNVTISGADDEEINEKLRAIYDSISEVMLEKKVSFLRSTLPE